MYRVLVDHPWASMTLMSTFYDGTGFLVFMDRSYGFVLQKLSFPIPEGQMQATAQQSLDLVPQGRLPNLHALTSMVAGGEYDGLFEYEYGLHALIAGLERNAHER